MLYEYDYLKRERTQLKEIVMEVEGRERGREGEEEEEEEERERERDGMNGEKLGS